MIRVLIAEDSAAVRTLLVSVLNADPEIEVVGEAESGAEAVRLTERLRPDAVTMDIQMPGLDGLQATEAIMARTPTPIIIVSSAVQRADVEMSLQATRVGALTALPKPDNPQSPDFEEDAAQLVMMVKAMSQVKVVRRWSKRAPTPAVATGSNGTPILTGAKQGSGSDIRVIAIAASTGGPAALEQVLAALPVTIPVPILIVQHIAKGFVQALASWLSGSCALAVKVAQHDEPLLPGTVYLAPDQHHMGVTATERISLSVDAPIGGFRPAGTALFRSVASIYGQRAAGIIMTGMGRDGVEGLKTLHAAGGWVIAQDEASCVVYGMPQEAVRAGVVDAVVPLADLAQTIVQLPLASATRPG